MARVALSCSIALSLLALASPAHAQILSDAEARDNASIDVRLKAVDDTKGVRLELYDPNERPPRHLPAVVCFERCAVHAVPGRYLLRVSGPPASDVLASKRFIDLEGSSDVYVDPPSKLQRNLGLILGIMGPTLVISGAGLMAMSRLAGGEGVTPLFTIGAVTASTGLVMTPVGWIMFGTNRKPEVTVRPKTGG